MYPVSLFSTFFIYLTSIYSFSFQTNDGVSTSLSKFQGKKMLIVNTSSGSQLVDQYGKLEQLYQLYKDSLVIIVFPSNAFGNEPKTDAEIKTFIQTRFQVHYVIAGQISVTGGNMSPLYQWLTSGVQNGSMSRPVLKDFQKYIIDSQGNLIAVFAAEVDPLDPGIQNLLK
jgi:glutathione peroxidase